MKKEEILKQLKDVDAVLEGHFLLSSGLHSDKYIQCEKLMMHPKKAETLCRVVVEKIKSSDFYNDIDYIISPAMGGIRIGYEMGKQLDVPTMFCERIDGEFALRRGFEIKKGSRILIVEDVVTTGKSSMEVAKYIKSMGGEIAGEACLIDRRDDHAIKMPFELISLIKLDIQTYEEGNLPEHLKNIPAIKPGSRNIKV